MVESVDDAPNAHQTHPLDSNVSPKLLPRVSISNIKSPSKRHLSNAKANLEASPPANMLDFLLEVK